jgi:hypothetical protein
MLNNGKVEVCLKEDVDKTLAENDKELRHQKHRRCLAMARRCHNESLWWYSKGYGFEKYDKFWEKWEKRWLELAEKFKEAK